MVGRATRVQVQEALAGASDKTLVGTIKPQQTEEVGKAAGTMDPATRVATTTVTLGAITPTKTTGN